MMGQGTGQRSNMTYSLYIGRVSEQKGLAAVTPGRVGIQSGDYQFTPVAGGNWLLKKQYDPATGLLTLTVDLSQQREEFENDRPNFCQPRSYCSYQPASILRMQEGQQLQRRFGV
jgi:hypothetical protein